MSRQEDDVDVATGADRVEQAMHDADGNRSQAVPALCGVPARMVTRQTATPL